MITAFTLNVSIDRRYVVDNAAVGAVNRVRECTASAGGKGLNVARVIHALDTDVTAAGIAGGALGEFIRQQLDAENIRHHFTKTSGETRCCINIYDTVTGTQTEFLEPGAPVSPSEFSRFLADFDELCADSDIITISGSLPKGLEADTYATLIKRADDMGKRVLLDVSGTPLAAALDAHPWYIKPNEDEIAAVAKLQAITDEQLRDAAAALCRRGISRVVISLGARGAMLACSDGVFIATPPHIDTANTVGCGDAMTAAFAVAAIRNMTPPDALRFAVAVSAASAMDPRTGGLNPADADALLPHITVQSL